MVYNDNGDGMKWFDVFEAERRPHIGPQFAMYEDQGGKDGSGDSDSKPDSKPDPKPDPKPEMYEITVAGEKKQVTMAELTKMAEKSGGADKRFQEAAEARELADLLKRAESDVGAFIELNKKLGRSEEEIQTYLGMIEEGSGSTPKPNPKPSTGGNGGEVVEAKLTPAQEKMLGEAHNAAVKQARIEAEENLKNVLDSDPVLGVEQVKDKNTREALFGMFLRDVQVRLVGGAKLSPETTTQSLQSLRETAKSLGILGRGPDGQPKETAEQKLTRLNIGLGPATKPVLDAVKAGKPIERKSITDPDYGDNLVMRTLLKQEETAK